jgi:YVTN family beta-propeller protein
MKRIKGHTQIGFVIAVVCLGALIFSTGCIPPSVTTTSNFNSQVGTTPAPTPDPTAITVIDKYSGNDRGCFASGLSQPMTPPPPPVGTGWQGFGTSPAVGQCNFSGFSPGTWNFEFFSNQCLTAGQKFDDIGPFTTDPSGHLDHTVCTIPASAAPAAGSHFAITGLLPSTVTISTQGLTTTYGMPKLLVYDSNLSHVATASATSAAPDGSSATFPFPSSLGQNTYMFAVQNMGASGYFNVVDATYYSIGGTTALTGAFGVDAGDITVKSWSCTPSNRGKCVPGTVGTSSVTTPTPILTKYYANQVTYNGHTFAVGNEPVAIREYGSSTVVDPNLYYDRVTTTQPAKAIVVNMGSGNVNLLDLVGKTVLATITVGTQPIAVTVNSTGTMAYVANYGSGTLSEVNLSTYAVARTATVGAGAQSVAMDPSGNYVWVGGPNYLKKVSLSTFAVVATQSVTGTVTSLAASNAQNELAYTLVNNCCGSSSTYTANELALSNFSPRSYAQAAATPYSPYTMNGTLPSAANIPHATYVSAQFGNGMAASATPTGFVVYDIVSHQQLMTGTTPTPVRGIASDPSNMTVFFTVPDSNEYITVPLPHL